MTSFMISQFIDRIPEYTLDDGCIFCKIIRRESPAHIVYEDAQVIAFLDTLPIRPGHTLLVPKAHHARLTDLPPELASALGVGLTKIGDAVAKGMDNPNLNFVCNQGYAQAVHHVHFHLVPAPIFATVTPAPSQEPSTPHSTRPPNPDAPPTTEAICKMERENRDELDDDDARRIVEKIRSKL